MIPFLDERKNTFLYRRNPRHKGAGNESVLGIYISRTKCLDAVSILAMAKALFPPGKKDIPSRDESPNFLEYLSDYPYGSHVSSPAGTGPAGPI